MSRVSFVNRFALIGRASEVRDLTVMSSTNMGAENAQKQEKQPQTQQDVRQHMIALWASYSIMLRLLMLFCLLSLAACEKDFMVFVTTNDAIPPTFRLEGGESVSKFSIFEVPKGEKNPLGSDYNAYKTLWSISSNRGVTAATKWPPITYSIVPDSFTQDIPSQAIPPVLEEGKIYMVQVSHNSSIIMQYYFVVQNGKAIIKPIYQLFSDVPKSSELRQ